MMKYINGEVFKLGMRLFSIFILFGALVLSIGAGRVHGQALDFKEEMAYGLNFFNGKGYSGSFSPKTEKTLYFLADHYNILAPRMTLVYFWSITKRMQAGWQSLNEPVEGTLEILQNGKVIDTLNKRDYSFFYPQGFYGDVAQVFLDQEAHDQFKQYQDGLEAYYGSLTGFYDEQVAYQLSLETFYEKLRVRTEQREEYDKRVEEYNDKLVKRAKEGGKEDIGPPPDEPNYAPIDVPVEPQRPGPPRFFSGEPSQAFVINLPEGQYSIRLRSPEGKIVEGGEKDLVVFSRRRTGGMGYEVVPGDLWRDRVTSSDPSEIFYVDGKSTLYLQPFHQDEFNDLYYAKLEDPQNNGQIGRHRWVNVKQEKDGVVQLDKGRETLNSAEMIRYEVQAGADRNFKIILFNEARAGDPQNPPTIFDGHKLELNLSKGGYLLRTLVKGKDILQGSNRQLRPVVEESQAVIYGPSLLSIIVLFGVLIWRRMKK